MDQVSQSSDDLGSRIAALLAEKPSRTARQISTVLRRQGYEAAKDRVNAVLYSNAERFQQDNQVPPRWCLATSSLQSDHKRTTHQLTGLTLMNWKAFATMEARFAGVTLFYGNNSAGKSSIFQSLLLVKQTWGNGELQFEGRHGSFGSLRNVLHRHDMERELRISALWGLQTAGNRCRLELRANLFSGHGIDELQHRVSEISCETPSAHFRLTRNGDDGDAPPSWLLMDCHVDQPSSAASITSSPLTVRSNRRGFPDLNNARGAVRRITRGGIAEIVTSCREAFADVSELLSSIEHIGPFREIPERTTTMDWAREHAHFLARLIEDADLVLDVNEWLTRFEIPYEIKISQIRDAGSNSEYKLTLARAGAAAETVQLTDVGFGVSQILPIIVQLLGSREKTILVEEPEAHIHPRLQSALGDLFVTSAQDYGNVVLVETHSEPILLRLQRRVAERRVAHDDVAVFHVLRQGESSTVGMVPLAQNGQLDYQWPGGFFDSKMDDLVAILDPQPAE